MTYTSREVYEYISLQTNDPIVSWKTCRISGTQFPIYTSDMAFYAKISPTFAGQKFQIPTPTLCPEERQRRRQSFKNEKRLYKRRCDATGEQIISIYSPDKSYKVYTNKYRRSDARNPMDYEQDFDFTKTFTDNFTNLSNRVPKDQLTKEFLEQENCDYTNAAGPSKNCYMVFEMGFNENCMYGSNINYSTNVVDGFFMNHTQNSYQCINCNNCNTIQYCFGCEDCSDCFLCTNLINKKYYIYNKQYTEGEYRQQIQKIQKDNPQGLQQIFETFLKQQDIYITTKQKSNEQTHGNYINNSHNTHIAYDCDDTRDCKHIYGTWGKVESCQDIHTRGENMSYSYELEQSGRNIYHCLFSALIWSRGSNIYYSNYCIGCNDLFGCEGLRNKSYCIFNKQYTKEEYDIHVAKIIAHMQTTGEWGEFFDPSLSPFGYNETVAMEYFPVSYDVGTKYFSSSDDTNRMNNNSSLHQWGYHRSDYTSDPVIPAGITTLTGDQVPSDISSVTDDICKQIIICEVSGRPFMIQKAELVFYRKHSIPLPRRHPDIRHEDRMKLRPGRTLHLRCCDKCGDEMLSVYPETVASSSLDKGRSGGGICEQNSQVYCEKCYQHEVYA